MIHCCIVRWPLESERQIHGIGKETYHLLFFPIKMLKPLRILFILKLHAWVSTFNKVIFI